MEALEENQIYYSKNLGELYSVLDSIGAIQEKSGGVCGASYLKRLIHAVYVRKKGLKEGRDICTIDSKMPLIQEKVNKAYDPFMLIPFTGRLREKVRLLLK